MTELSKPELSQTVDGYELKWSAGIEASVERLVEHRDELTAEVTFRSVRVPRPGLLHRARLNLMSSQSRKTLASALEKREVDLDWSAMLEQLCFLVSDHYRRGDPEIDLREYCEMPATRWLLEPFVESGGPTVLFADGGTGKSMVALAIATSIASGTPILGTLRSPAVPVLYLDWETDTATANERLRALCAGAGIFPIPPVFYRRQVASLPESAAEIRRVIQKRGIGFVIVDSLGAARGGEPESADVTIRTFAAARSFGVPWLAVDHVTKQAGNDATKPFGSAFTANLARLTWSMDKSDEAGESTVKVALMSRKSNNVYRQKPLGYQLAFERDEDGILWSVGFKALDVATDIDMGHRASLSDQIRMALKSGGLSVKEMNDATGMAGDSIRRTAERMRERGDLLREPDGKYWLASRSN